LESFVNLVADEREAALNARRGYQRSGLTTANFRAPLDPA